MYSFVFQLQTWETTNQILLRGSQSISLFSLPWRESDEKEDTILMSKEIAH